MNEKNRKLCDYAHGVRCPYCGSTVSLKNIADPFCNDVMNDLHGENIIPIPRINVWHCDNMSCGAQVDCIRNTAEPQGILLSSKAKSLLQMVDLYGWNVLLHSTDRDLVKTMLTEAICDTLARIEVPDF